MQWVIRASLPFGIKYVTQTLKSVYMNQAGATKKGFSAYTEKVTQFFSDMMDKGKHLVTNTYDH